MKNPCGNRSMPKANIIYLSINMRAYSGAMYQQDVMKEIAQQANVFFYGPGYPGYNLADDIQAVITKSDMQPDYIILGHAWLSDVAGEPVDPHESLNLKRTNTPKIAIINKEYVNLVQKLEYLKINQFDLVFTHHHDIETYSKETGIKFIFWPFAFDHRKFFSNGEEKRPYDFAFSGILQNQNRNAQQTDLRLRLQKRIFVCLGDLPFFKKRDFRSLNVFWNSIPRRKFERSIAFLLRRYKYMAREQYSELQRKTKIYVNTLSPMGLVSPRFFENMSSRALVFCEASQNYERIFPNECYVSFRNDLKDFKEKVDFFLLNEKERKRIVDLAFREVMNNHTWEKRVNSMLRTLIQEG